MVEKGRRSLVRGYNILAKRARILLRNDEGRERVAERAAPRCAARDLPCYHGPAGLNLVDYFVWGCRRQMVGSRERERINFRESAPPGCVLPFAGEEGNGNTEKRRGAIILCVRIGYLSAIPPLVAVTLFQRKKIKNLNCRSRRGTGINFRLAVPPTSAKYLRNLKEESGKLMRELTGELTREQNSSIIIILLNIPVPDLII
jgi:hypothetical protein